MCRHRGEWGWCTAVERKVGEHIGTSGSLHTVDSTLLVCVCVQPSVLIHTLTHNPPIIVEHMWKERGWGGRRERRNRLKFRRERYWTVLQWLWVNCLDLKSTRYCRTDHDRVAKHSIARIWSLCMCKIYQAYVTQSIQHCYSWSYNFCK